ncbi:hypothetical protein FEM48_Zijuj06G0146100 [Ziziphus jujuba var. spinosa]|uniref:Uncharacterized protein n=1 Tax=Ziziphus jujuba var. spinosa TaxID=714518 RepID=A0A978V9V2_ZIZJJ|nr:hypothetical protein FEM48_Zijuj06G0146100 [Ziziphus jujuba var. spinosa]
MRSSNQALSDIENPYESLATSIPKELDSLPFLSLLVKDDRLLAETIGFSSDEFVKIILVDSAFIVEDVWPDLCLLENQLPFFILEELYNLDKITLSSGHIRKFSIIELSHIFFTELMHLEGIEKLEKIKLDNVAYFFNFLSNLYVPLNPRSGRECESLTAPRMTELHRVEVKFKVGSTKNLFDINFNNGILEIPKLTISNEIKLTIRNPLAFEQCHCMDNYLNDYVVVMDHLVNIPYDVDLLVKYGIVENRPGDSDEGASLISNLANGIIMDSKNFYFFGSFWA